MFHYLLQDSGGELAEVKGGIQECLIQGLNTGTLDLQVNGWGHKVRLLSLTKKNSFPWKHEYHRVGLDRLCTSFQIGCTGR
jgi:hypothetical protein